MTLDDFVNFKKQLNSTNTEESDHDYYHDASLPFDGLFDITDDERNAMQELDHIMNHMTTELRTQNSSVLSSDMLRVTTDVPFV